MAWRFAKQIYLSWPTWSDLESSTPLSPYHERENTIPNIHDPNAKQAQALCPGYRAIDIQKTELGLKGALRLAGEPCDVYGTDIEYLDLLVEVQSANRLHISIQPTYLSSTNISHYILPDNLAQTPSIESPASFNQNDLQFDWTNDPSFAFSLSRRSTGDVIFDTFGTALVYENQFIEFVSKLPKNYNLYGLGERIHDFRLGNEFVATFWTADAGDPIDRNIYGSHPFYLETRYFAVDNSSGKRVLVTENESAVNGTYESWSHGVYQRNAHGMEVLLNPTNITWRALGGSIDLYFFDGPTASDVTKQYTTGAVGLPAMQMYNTFGFHQCRWGYENWTVVEKVVENHRKADIPLEYIWLDIDILNKRRPFDNDPDAFPNVAGRDLIERLEKQGQYHVPIVDAAVYRPESNDQPDVYPPYIDGLRQEVFLKNSDGSEYIGEVWPGSTVFPDWHAEHTRAWWLKLLTDYHDQIPWNGIWLDMNEIATFCNDDSCGGRNQRKIVGQPPLNSSPAPIAKRSTAFTKSDLLKNDHADSRDVNHPPYAINNIHGDLALHTVSPDTAHADGVLEYDVHNLFAHRQINATYEGLTEIFPGRRPFIISRSTFAGSGKWAGHWGGDNASLFAYMYFSISQALNFALFGIPMFGVDTCGFGGATDEELCNRWMQLSAFFPFYRNHNSNDQPSQEAYMWPSVAEASRKAMKIRYSLLPYLYTLFYQAHTTGSTVMRALSWEFPHDPLLASIDNQFLLGPSLLVIPVLARHSTVARGIFPGIAHGQLWYDWYTHERVVARHAENVTIPAPLGHIPVYIRGGAILPQQEALYTTRESRHSPWSLLCALTNDGTARGEIYIDDGESIEPEEVLQVDLVVAKGSLKAVSRGEYDDRNALANVTVMGVSSQPTRITFEGKELRHGVVYNATSHVLSIKNLQAVTEGGAWKKNWTLTWT